MDNELVKQLSAIKVGDYITFEEEKQKYEVRARSNRFLVCTKPFNARKTVLYTIIDIEKGIRGPENLVFGAGAETTEDCEDMIKRLEGTYSEIGCHTDISYRNNIPVKVKMFWLVGR